MNRNKLLKIVTVTVLFAGLIIDLPVFFSALFEAIQHQKLTGGGRAQAEVFLMPMFFVTPPIAVVAFFIIVLNIITDIFTKKTPTKISLLIYAGLIILIMIPGTDFLLLDLMYSGWK